MSLVNDMLRDLDDRRREPTGAGVGTAKLMPATAAPRAGRSLKMLFSLVGLLMLAAAVAFLGWQYFRQPEAFPELSLRALAERAIGADPAPATVSNAVASPADVAGTPQVQTPEQLELAMIAKRMEELEVQNRALLEAQAQMAARSAAEVPAFPAVATQDAVQVEQLSSTNLTAAVGNIDPAFANALAIDPAAAADQAILQPAVQTNEPLVEQQSAAPMRSPTEMSFADQDRGRTQEALTLWGRNQRAEAVALLQEFIGVNPLAHQSRETLAKLMLQENDIKAVTELVHQGMAVAPEFAGYRKLQARLLLSEGKMQETVSLLSGQAPPVSVDSEYHDLLATAQLSMMDFAGAAGSYQALVQQNRNEARWWYGLAAAWDGQGREAEALQAYQQALTLPSLSAGLRQRSERRVVELGL